MRRVQFLLALISISALSSSCGPGLPEPPNAQLTIKCVDDDGQPVPNAKVAVVGFRADIQGKTDATGRFVAKLRNASGEVDLEADKGGFYSIDRQTYIFPAHTNGQWLPWNPTVELQLHRVGKPVPMVVKKVVEEDIPAVSRTAGYDLLAGDWVEPYGRGKIADFTIEVLKPIALASNDWMRLHLTFSNPDDGLLLKRMFYRDDYGLRLAALAPKSGYSNRWEWQACESNPSANPGWIVLKNGDQDANFYFRIRSKTNEQGQVVSAMYGKVYDGFQFGSATYPDRMPLRFLYYLNPDGTRNTEFDTRSNLCPNPGTAGGRP
jgi:hypothetical protein